MQNLIESGKFDPMPVITHRFPLADFAKAFELAESGEAGKGTADPTSLIQAIKLASVMCRNRRHLSHPSSLS